MSLNKSAMPKVNVMSLVSDRSPVVRSIPDLIHFYKLNSSSRVQFSVTVSQRNQRVTLFQSHLHLFVVGNLPSNVVLLWDR